MILTTKVVEQSINRDTRGVFIKDLLLVQGRSPIALVRKRRAAAARNELPENLEHAEPVAPPTRGAVLLVHGYGQNRYAFHLPSRSFVNHLASAGFDVFNVDLRGHGRSEHFGAKLPNRVEEFVREDLPQALHEVLQVSGHERAFLVGHSLGGLCSYAMATTHPSEVAGVVTLGSPYHFTRGAKLLAGFGQAFLMVDKLLDLPNYPVPAQLYGSFVRVSQRLVESPLYPVPLRGFRRGSMEPDVLRQHMALAMDQGSIATMRALFSWAGEVSAHEPERRSWGLGKKRPARENVLFGMASRFERQNVPLLVIAGSQDDLAPPESVRPAHDRSSSRDRSYREFPAGHIDIIMGTEAPTTIWPLITSWLERRAQGARQQAA